MSFTYGFYDSLNGDRKYSAEQFGSIYEGVVNDGIFMSIGQCFAVYASTGMTLNVGTGRAWFNGTWCYNDALYSITIPTASATFDRIDAIAIKVDKSVANRKTTIEVIQGEASSSPEKPDPEDTDTVFYHIISYIKVGKAVTSISGTAITTNVGTDDCPYVTGILQVHSVDTLTVQFKARFEEWLATFVDNLTDDQAVHLQSEINALNSKIENWDMKKVTLTTDESKSIRFGYDSSGNMGWIDPSGSGGADSVTPFKTQADLDAAYVEGCSYSYNKFYATDQYAYTFDWECPVTGSYILIIRTGSNDHQHGNFISDRSITNATSSSQLFYQSGENNSDSVEAWLFSATKGTKVRVFASCYNNYESGNHIYSNIVK